jgi:hypothetical protein
MTLTLELTEEEEARLRKKADRAGLAPAAFLLSLIDLAPSDGFETANDNGKPQSGADLLAELKALNLRPGYGDPSIDSPELARRLRKQFSERQH